MHVCTKCSRPIEPPSPIATYENNYYHPDCLKCNICSQALSGRQFIKEKNGTLTCEECNAKVAPKCTKCKKIFGPGILYKKISDDIFYHNECFICAGPCRKPIGADFYDLENGKFLCESCYDKYDLDYEKYMDNDNRAPPPPVPKNEPPYLPSSNPPPRNDIDKLSNQFQSSFNVNLNNSKPNVEHLPPVQRERDPKPEPRPAAQKDNAEKCAKCNQVLSGTISVYNEKKYHTKCFVCNQCNEEFKEKSFFKLNGNPICRTCHSRNLVDNASRCHKCFQPILETVVTFKNNEFHDYCLVCSLCSCKLAGQSIYTDKADQPYCTACFTKKEGKSCSLCRQIISPSQPNLIFEDKYFHKECFKCEGCRRVISSNESFYKGDQANGVICTSCI
ncbi:unnamed protein product [Brachionus calyciflorus]|uniref:LIM zinc-binding domain-containing protein n=1 Tax=Brachionus calyciflorus TaxID=104777 RepID=A0A813T1V5_9BILA|nr:unnamed protein product [Brachionus calyciflorus]